MRSLCRHACSPAAEPDSRTIPSLGDLEAQFATVPLEGDVPTLGTWHCTSFPDPVRSRVPKPAPLSKVETQKGHSCLFPGRALGLPATG